MKQNIREYADILYEGSRMQSAANLRNATTDFLKERSARQVMSYTQFSGPDIQRVAAISNAHIERCIRARFDSYHQAFQDDDSLPSLDDFGVILFHCKTVRDSEISNGVRWIAQIVLTHGGGGSPSVPDQGALEASSAHGMDTVMYLWKAWKAKAQLKSEKIVRTPEKQFDALLPIYNRAEFEKDIKEQTANGDSVPVSLLFMDLDKFKQINDGPGGHEAGDRALRAFAEVVVKSSQHKGLAYRYGGDELCVLLPNHSLEEASAVAERIRQAVRSVRTAELTDGLNTSIGVSSFPESTSDATKLCKAADKAMYRSKKAGGNQVSRADNAASASESP